MRKTPYGGRMAWCEISPHLVQYRQKCGAGTVCGWLRVENLQKEEFCPLIVAGRKGLLPDKVSGGKFTKQTNEDIKVKT